jgi:hypothetical protein
MDSSVKVPSSVKGRDPPLEVSVLGDLVGLPTICSLSFSFIHGRNRTHAFRARPLLLEQAVGEDDLDDRRDRL